MDNAGQSKDEQKIVDWRNVTKDFIPWARVGRFIAGRVPQVFTIWAAVAVLLKLPPFVSAFDMFGHSFKSPFFKVGSIGIDQPVDISPIFLIGFAVISVELLCVSVLYFVIKFSRRVAKTHPVKMERWASRFANKMTDEFSSLLTHCSAATVVLLIHAWPEIHGSRVAFLCESMAAFTFVFGAVCYRGT